MLRSHRMRLAGLLAATFLSASVARAADAKYLPDDTEIVLTVNIRQILGSELVKGQKDAVDQVKTMALNALQQQPQIKKYMEAAGIDPFRDLTSVTVALPGRKDPDAAFLLVEGAFNYEKFHDAAELAAKENSEVLKITKSGSFKIFEIASPDGKKAFICMASKGTIVACANRDRLTDALARHDGSKKPSLKKNVKVLLETTNTKQSVSGVATGNALSKLMEDAPIPNAQQVGPILQGIDGLSGALTIEKEIQFQIGVATKDAETATDFAQKANFGLLLAKGVVAQKAKEDEKLVPLVDVVNTLTATAQGSSLIVRGQITVANIEKLIKNFNPQK